MRSRLTDAALADAYARAAATKKAADKAADTLRKEVLERLTEAEARELLGDTWAVELVVTHQERIDPDAVRRLLSPRQLKSVVKDVSVRTLNVRAAEHAEIEQAA